MSSQFPPLRIQYWGTAGNEHYFKDDGVLRMVVSQMIPVRLELLLPGMNSRPEVCFPAPFQVRVYSAGPHPDNEIASYRREYDSYPEMPLLVDYKFGLNEVPWMFDGYLPRNLFKIERDAVANFVIENGSSGCSGVVIQVTRRENRAEESLKIFRFSTGNDYNFFERWKSDPNTALLAEFVPTDSYSRELHWVPVRPAVAR